MHTASVHIHTCKEVPYEYLYALHLFRGLMVNSSKHWGSDSRSLLEASATVSLPAVMALVMLLNVYLRQQCMLLDPTCLCT